MDEICTSYHKCHRCSALTLCETFKAVCPWRDEVIQPDLEGWDGALCLSCTTELMKAMQKEVDWLNGDD